MKKLTLALFAILTLLGFTALSQPSDTQYPANQAYNANYIVLASLTSANTNSVGVASTTNRIDANLHHTVQAYCSSSTSNYFAIAIDKSLDSTNWTLGNTNLIATTLTSGVNETNWVGKVAYIRVRTFGTNVTGQVNYLGGR